MKKILMILTIALVSCGPSKEEMEARERSERSTKQTTDERFEIITIDGCEYIVSTYYSNNSDILTHKGNCKNKNNH